MDTLGLGLAADERFFGRREARRTPDEAGLPVIDQQRCLGCAQCVGACPEGALRAASVGLAVYVGGKHGRHPRPGTKLAAMYPEDGALKLIQQIISCYQEHGRPRERLGVVVDRLGIEGFVAAVDRSAPDGWISGATPEENEA